jgi:hypothetical protein
LDVEGFDWREGNGEATLGGDLAFGGNRLAHWRLQTDHRPDSGGGVLRPS